MDPDQTDVFGAYSGSKLIKDYQQMTLAGFTS